jgi:biofilm PGA synthesis N-glycosyltransferase PgaC
VYYTRSGSKFAGSEPPQSDMKGDCINYFIISPVKDEANFIEETIKSVIRQSIKPLQWIIVDDGSKDGTIQVVESYCRNYGWIKLVELASVGKRQPGSGVIKAFNVGYELIKDQTFDIIVKMDCDLKFPDDYFEKIISKFQENEKLGIASGIYLEKHDNEWIPISMPDYHAAGATKVIRKKCFDEIGGFIPQRSWDTIDEIRAQMKGWETGHFTDIEFYHLKHEGSGIGMLRTNVMLGEIYYLTGGGLLFFFLKFINKMIWGKPFLLAGLMMLFGFLEPSLSGKKRMANEEEAAFYRKLLNQRIFNRIKSCIN